MNRSSKHYLSFGVILAGLSCVVQTGLGGTAEPGLKITLRVYNHAHVDSKTLIRAEQEVTRIYRKIGVETVWVDQPLLPEQKQDDSPRLQTSYIGLSILPRAMAECLSSSALGMAPGAERNRAWAYVFYDRVDDLSRKQIAEGARGKMGRWATTAQILGYAMAHEFGHLLGLDAHSPTGIMRAAWRWSDLLDAAYGDLDFTPPQAAVIRMEVRIRQH